MLLSEPTVSGGLLDFVKSPEGQGLLSAAFGGLAGARRGTPLNNIGRAGGAGLLGFANAQDQQGQMADRAFKTLQQQRQQQEWAKSDKIDALAPQFLSQGSGGATNLVNDALPPEMQIGALPALPNAKPAGFDTQGYVNALMAIDPVKGLAFQQSIKPKELPFGKVDPKDYTPESIQAFATSNGDYTKLVPIRKKEVVNGQAVDLYSAPEGKVFDQRDPNKAFNLVDGQAVPNAPFQNYEVNKARAGASNVSVNTGQKGFDNELKLRGDFRSEPVYKAHQEMTSAYGQIQQSLQQKSPAGDLAGATKIMKLLDPGSVVRESELGMAMQASGLMDRVTNYGNMVISGQKLTPTQRADFQNLADKLYAESVKGYNSKQSEYGDIANQYQLNGPLITGKPAAMPTAPASAPAMRWNPKTRKLDKVE